MKKNKFLFLIFSFLALLSVSCDKDKNAKIFQESINLKDRFYWAECDRNSSIEEAEKLSFHKLNTYGFGNINKLLSGNHEYIWLMVVFPLPEHLRNKALALFITYLHFADKVWVNGTYIGGYGSFPPNAKGSLWSPHYYFIPDTILNNVGRNTLLIKVYCKGRSGISDHAWIGDADTIRNVEKFHSFFQSTVYLFTEGGMFITALLFFLVYIWRKKEREYLSFSLLCLSSLIFTTPFFASTLPLNFPNDISFLTFIELTLCEGTYLMVFFFATMLIEFTVHSETNIFRIIRLSIFAFCTIITISAPDYDFLMRICPFMIFLSVFQMALGYICVLSKKRSAEEKMKLKLFSFVLTPLGLSIILDFFVKLYLQKIDFPYITLAGWEITCLCFLILLSIRFSKAVSQNEYLNVQLRREVDERTRELSEKNTELEHQIFRAETDLDMASLVQKKFFPYPPNTLYGWDISVSSSPLDKVSGDMFDFYAEDNTLHGFSLFDVSGHGIAASLVTMLAKNIINQSFHRNFMRNSSVSRTLYEINDEIIEAKGGIENYLTGLMFRFRPFDENDVCKVEMANAGHPNPFFYSAADGICEEIKSGDSKRHHGAIGLDFITVAFPQISFKMAENDILLFYTDGLTESRNTYNEMFGKDRIKKILRQSYAKDAQSIMEDIIDELSEFTKGTIRDDDITLVVMKRINSNMYIEELTEI